MNSEIYKIRISPEVLSTDIVSETYQTNTFGVYSAMTSVLSGGTNGSSLLTGLTIDVVFQNSFNDLGFYTPFDGFILQKEVVNNFIFSASTIWNVNLMFLQSYAWIVGAIVSSLTYYLLAKK